MYNFDMSERKRILIEITSFVVVEGCVIFWLMPNFLTDWDSYLYTYSGLTFTPITLASGRWLFSVLLGSVWRILNIFFTISVDDAWQVFSFTTICFALANVVLFYLLARKLLVRTGAIIATSIFVSSPLIAMYGSAVMTETYALSALLICMLILISVSVRLSDAECCQLVMKRLLFPMSLAGVSFGFACAIREPMIFMIFLPAGIIWSLPKDYRYKLLVTFIVSMIFVLSINQLGAYLRCENYQAVYARWLAGMKFERSVMIDSVFELLVRNILFLMCWLVIFSPVLVFTIPNQIKILLKGRYGTDKDVKWIKPAIIAICAYFLAEIANHSLIFNPRFVIFPAVIMCLLAGLSINRKIFDYIRVEYVAGFIILLQIGLLFVTMPIFEKYYFDKAQAARQIYETLNKAPDKALFIPGKFTPVIEFYNKLYHRNWAIAYSGWAFSPTKLKRALADAKKENKKIYIVERKYFPDKRYRPMQYNVLSNIEDSSKVVPSDIRHFDELK